MCPPMRSFALTLGLQLLLVGCGGSSSETPPPLEPDPTSFEYTGPRIPSAADDAVSSTPAAAEPDELAPKTSGAPASGTWGSGKAAAPPSSSAK
jgi:hypothetical protein